MSTYQFIMGVCFGINALSLVICFFDNSPWWHKPLFFLGAAGSIVAVTI